MTTHITSTSGMNDHRVAGEDARLLHELSSDLDASSRNTKLSGSRDFAIHALRAGWIDRAGRLQGRLDTSSFQPRLRRVEIEVSTRCNFSCAYCFSESSPSQKDQMSTSDIIETARAAADMGVDMIDLTGGELTIHRDWKAIITEIRRLGLPVSLHTNGSRLTAPNVEFLKNIGVRQLQVTVESHLAEVQEAIRGPKGSFDRIIEGIRRARAAGLVVRVVALVHRENIATIQESVRFFQSELMTSVYLDRVISTGTEGSAKMAVSEEEFWEAIEPLIHEGNKATRVCTPEEPQYADADTEPECGVGHSFLYLTAEGEFAICPTMTSREAAVFSGPRIHERVGLREAWEASELFNKYRDVNCENLHKCPAGGACGGGCRSNAYAATGSVTAPDQIQCNVMKNPGKTFVPFRELYRRTSG
ncbi:radical SAM protein [Curtobacterium luteum]|uniref:radical SAM protein n=1 Tax=Curtobacterium luteum TaxID=33881 RepID=UPI00382EB331